MTTLTDYVSPVFAAAAIALPLAMLGAPDPAAAGFSGARASSSFSSFRSSPMPSFRSTPMPSMPRFNTTVPTARLAPVPYSAPKITIQPSTPRVTAPQQSSTGSTTTAPRSESTASFNRTVPLGGFGMATPHYTSSSEDHFWRNWMIYQMVFNNHSAPAPASDTLSYSSGPAADLPAVPAAVAGGIGNGETVGTAPDADDSGLPGWLVTSVAGLAVASGTIAGSALRRSLG